MSRQRLLESVAEVKRLAESLSHCKSVTRFDTGDEKEAWTLAHCLADLEASFRVILDQHLPRLISDGSLTPEEVEDLLHDIGEELRHIVYHIKDPRYYRYLLDDPGKQ